MRIKNLLCDIQRYIDYQVDAGVSPRWLQKNYSILNLACDSIQRLYYDAVLEHEMAKAVEKERTDALLQDCAIWVATYITQEAMDRIEVM